MNTIPEDLRKKVTLPGFSDGETFTVPPLHTWPHFLKKAVLFGAVLIVLLSYLLLAGGLLGGLMLVLKAIAR